MFFERLKNENQTAKNHDESYFCLLYGHSNYINLYIINSIDELCKEDKIRSKFDGTTIELEISKF